MRWFLLSGRIQGSERVGVVLSGENGTKQNGGRNPRARVSPGAIGCTNTALRVPLPRIYSKAVLVLSDLLPGLLISITHAKGLPHAIKIISFIGF